MFLKGEYLAENPTAPDFSDDPMMKEVTKGQYDRWLPIKIDLLSICDIAHIGEDDRCEILYFNGWSRVVHYSFEEMSDYHSRVQATFDPNEEDGYEMEDFDDPETGLEDGITDPGFFRFGDKPNSLT